MSTSKVRTSHAIDKRQRDTIEGFLQTMDDYKAILTIFHQGKDLDGTERANAVKRVKESVWWRVWVVRVADEMLQRVLFQAARGDANTVAISACREICKRAQAYVEGLPARGAVAGSQVGLDDGWGAGDGAGRQEPDESEGAADQGSSFSP